MRSVEEIKAELADAYAARRALMRAEEYTTADGRRLRRPDLDALNSTINSLEKELVRAKNGGGLMMRRIVPDGL